jgi:hypothetical protein
MPITIDLRTNDPRSPFEELGGIKLLARIIDKGRAAIAGTLGQYIFYDCVLDQIFFDAVNVSRSEFLEVLRRAYASHLSSNADALADLRESLACEPEVTDAQFFTYAEACDADNAAVRWLVDQRRTSPSILDAINSAVERLPPEALVDWCT